MASTPAIRHTPTEGTPFTSRTHSDPQQPHSCLVRWYPSPTGTFKINFDGSCKNI